MTPQPQRPSPIRGVGGMPLWLNILLISLYALGIALFIIAWILA